MNAVPSSVSVSAGSASAAAVNGAAVIVAKLSVANPIAATRIAWANVIALRVRLRIDMAEERHHHPAATRAHPNGSGVPLAEQRLVWSDRQRLKVWVKLKRTPPTRLSSLARSSATKRL